MKGKDAEKLRNDLIKYCDQIGILPDEIPHLEFERKRYNQIRKDVGCKRNARHDRSGECIREARTIFVDGRQTQHHYVDYNKRTNKSIRQRMVKATYRSFRYILVHELTHYRFRNLYHGYEFEIRTNEILAGKKFEPKSVIITDEEKQETQKRLDERQKKLGLNWRKTGIKAIVEYMSFSDQVIEVIKSAEFVDKHYHPTTDVILQELRLKLGKYLSDQVINEGYNLFLQAKTC